MFARLRMIQKERFYFEVVKPEIDFSSPGIEFPKRSCMSVMWLRSFHKKLTEVNISCHSKVRPDQESFACFRRQSEQILLSVRWVFAASEIFFLGLSCLSVLCHMISSVLGARAKYVIFLGTASDLSALSCPSCVWWAHRLTRSPRQMSLHPGGIPATPCSARPGLPETFLWPLLFPRLSWQCSATIRKAARESYCLQLYLATRQPTGCICATKKPIYES